MRLLSWNINRFTLNNLWKVDNRLDNFDEWLATYDWSMLNKKYVMDTVRTADPTVFVVIETQSTRGLVGTLIEGGGKTGSLWLLDHLRSSLSEYWCLVPPTRIATIINTNAGEVNNENQYTEGISVYYRSDRVEFQGPYIYSPQAGRAVPNSQPNVAGAYPADWADCLPAGNYYAGQPQFHYAGNGAEITFPQPASRRPFLTKFREFSSGRTYMITSVHLPPTPAAQQNFDANPEGIPAWIALAKIVNDIPELSNANQVANGNQANVIVGDININIDLTQSNSQLGFFRQWINSMGYMPVFMQGGNSMITEVNNATPANYARGSMLDNCFVSYYPQIPFGQPYPYENLAVAIDRVAGTQVGNMDFYGLMYNPLQTFAGINDEAQRDATFRERRNYGHIAHFSGISDHLPILIEI